MMLQLVILQDICGGGGLDTLQQLVFFRPPIEMVRDARRIGIGVKHTRTSHPAISIPIV